MFKWKRCVVDFDERMVVVLGGLRRNQSGGRFGRRNFQVAVGEELNKLRKVCILVSRKRFDVGTGIVEVKSSAYDMILMSEGGVGAFQT